MDITYTKHGDYYYPDLELPPQLTNDIGRFGRMRKKYRLSLVGSEMCIRDSAPADQ